MQFSNQSQKSELILNYISEERSQYSESRFTVETVRDQSPINFNDLLQRQWSLQQSGIQSKKVYEDITPEQSKGNNEPRNYREAEMMESSLKQHSSLGFVKFSNGIRSYKNIGLKSVSTVLESYEKEEDLTIFLKSTSFAIFIKFGIILNIVGLIMFDYSYRINIELGEEQNSMRNVISLNFQLFAGCIFTMEILFQLLSSELFFKHPWKCFNLITTLAFWSTIFLNIKEYDESLLFQLTFIVRSIKSLRIIQVVESLKTPFQSFLATLPSLKKIFFPLSIFILFYAIIGMILFGGATEYRCRATQVPEVNATEWPQVDSRLCGSLMLVCPKGFCGNPFYYNLQRNKDEEMQQSNQYGLVNFDNLFSAILSVYHYALLSNWTSIKYKFSRFISPYVTAIYFVTCAIFLFFITANLIMISLAKAYEQKQKSSKNDIEENFEQIDLKKQKTRLCENSPSIKYLNVCDIIMILVQCVVTVSEYEKMSPQWFNYLCLLDFILTWVSLFLLIWRLLIFKKKAFDDVLTIIDWVVVLVSIADIFYCLGKGQPVISSTEFSQALRSLKFIRIIRILFISQSWFVYQRKLVKLFFMTLKSMSHFLILLFCIVLTFSFIGSQMFAYRVRFDSHHQINIQKGKPYVFNFQSIFKSIIHLVSLFENQRWTETMYNYYYATGVKAIFFFCITVLIVHLMLTRLFIAMFLIYFRNKLQERQNDEQNDLTNRNDVVKENIEEVINISENHFDDDQKQHRKSAKFQDKLLNEKILFILDRDSCICRIARLISSSNCMHYLINIAVALYCATLLLRTNHNSPLFQETLFNVERFPIFLYLFELLVGVIGYGFCKGELSYLNRSFFNVLNFIVCILAVISEINLIDPLSKLIIRRFIVLKIFIIFKDCNKEMSIIIQSLAHIFKKFIRMYGIYMVSLLITCLIPLKMQKNDYYACHNYDSHVFTVADDIGCFNAGGDWVKETQSFKNIITSWLLMYQIVTSESWTYFIEKSNPNEPWDFYFVATFFIYNICLLNIFVGVTVETYLELKNKAFKLNLLKSNQKAWILIKNCINELVPSPSVEEPVNSATPIKIAFKIAKYPPYEDFIDLLAFLNLIILSMNVYRASDDYFSIVHFFDKAFLVAFALDTLLKLIVYRQSFFYLDNSKVDTVGLIVYIVLWIMQFSLNLSNDQIRVSETISATFQLLRCKKVLFRFKWSRTLVNSIIQVLPKCLNIGKFLFTFLFIYVAIGLQLFKHTKASPKSDGYTNGFANFLTGILTLLKISSNESWFEQVSAYVRVSTPIDVCFNIVNISDANKYSGMGCGSYLAYPFLISFHVLMSLVILNLLIATMVSAYDENYEKQYNSVNIFQLEECLSLWQKYDPKGSGVIEFKKFWRLSSQIAILFGISKKKLIKSKQKFLEELNIGIYYSNDPLDTPKLCYRFHDVITRFSMIKLEVSVDKTDEKSNEIDFDINPSIQQQLTDYISKVPSYIYQKYQPYSNYTSAQMKYFFSLLRKMRAWKVAAKFKSSNTVVKLTQIIKIAMKKRKEQAKVMNMIARNRKTLLNLSSYSLNQQKIFKTFS